MSDEHRESRFSSSDAVEVAEYPRINRAAVAALLLGLASWSALTNALLWFLPLIGIVLATVALRSIARSQEPVLGRRAAVIGLALSIVFASWAPTQYFIRQELLYRQAKEHAEYWLGLVREGHLHEAHQLTMSKGERQSPDVNLSEFYLDKPQLLESFDGFCEDTPMSKVIKLDGKGDLRFVGRGAIETDKPIGLQVDLITLRWAIDATEGDQSQTIPFILAVGKTRVRGTSEAFWFVRGIRSPGGL